MVVEDNSASVHTCPHCKEDMRWDIKVTASRGDYRHVSESLAINPSQAKAHTKMFPGVAVLPDGKLEFTSVKSQEQYCDKTGFHKVTQKTKTKGVRIA
jgi:hypothetical protein